MGTGRGAGRGPGFGTGLAAVPGCGVAPPDWAAPVDWVGDGAFAAPPPAGLSAGLGAGFGCAERGDGLPPPLEASPLPNASVSLRTTGASIVEDADLTNSPISVSLAMTTLLSTPNSLASSYTRTFATALPNSVREPCSAAGPSLTERTHRRVLIRRS